MDWYDKLVQGATVSLSRMFDPNYYPVRAATMPSSPYSDSRGQTLQELFDQTRPFLKQRNDTEPMMGEDGWQINRIPVPRVARPGYKGYL